MSSKDEGFYCILNFRENKTSHNHGPADDWQCISNMTQVGASNNFCLFLKIS
jgi:hypothetical protein